MINAKKKENEFRINLKETDFSQGDRNIFEDELSDDDMPAFRRPPNPESLEKPKKHGFEKNADNLMGYLLQLTKFYEGIAHFGSMSKTRNR